MLIITQTLFKANQDIIFISKSDVNATKIFSKTIIIILKSFLIPEELGMNKDNFWWDVK